MKIFLGLFCLQFIISSCATAATLRDPLSLDTFSFGEPRTTDLGKKLTLWATNYYLPQLVDGSGEYPLRDKAGVEIGPRLSHRGWCDSAMEGSVRVLYKNGEARTFNYAGTSTDYPVNCKEYFKIDVSKSKFGEAIGPYGDGYANYILEPYRTIASDNTQIPLGTVVYVPKARGAQIQLKSGRVITHDGYFFVGDRGGAIKGNHIDVFIGTDSNAPYFPWIQSNQSKVFEAYPVIDQQIISELTLLHKNKF
jgi:3D (Asp-Asp-Asp) domain-containing protein